jgi:hypothetical protein
MSAQRGGRAARSGNMGVPSLAPLNPERVPPLLGKYAKYIGKDLEKIEVTYSAEGAEILVYGKEKTPFESLRGVSLAEFRAARSEENAPTESEKLRSFRNKFELRLKRECPKTLLSGSDTAIQAFLDGLPFKERRAMLMSQKQFQAEYPNGYTQA